MTDLAPIILFTYNRPEHTRITLEHLQNNILADQSTLYIYCDGLKEEESKENINKVKQVEDVVRSKQWAKEVHIINSRKNKGLARNIIEGVTEVVKKHGKIIVLEDDLVTSKYFLEYMNIALSKYEGNEEVMQISGYSFPIDIQLENDSYFLKLSTTWGWGTWSRVWNNMDFECKDYSILKKDKELAKRFNFNGAYNYKKMFIRQMESNGKISSWGIRFWWNVFKKEGLVLYPDSSLIKNNGWDNSGRHKDNYDLFPIKEWGKQYQINNYPKSLSISNKKSKLVYNLIKKRTSYINKIVMVVKDYFKPRDN